MVGFLPELLRHLRGLLPAVVKDLVQGVVDGLLLLACLRDTERTLAGGGGDSLALGGKNGLDSDYGARSVAHIDNSGGGDLVVGHGE